MLSLNKARAQLLCATAARVHFLTNDIDTRFAEITLPAGDHPQL